ncbi:hypothetical protein GCM10009662_01920 [Catellatospora coxensis]|uniref:Aminoglycoside phosphotransferase domain-containing protein n=2 Tax=Catellatospora coxensis TaxID=310354 RepID=A0A8J3KMD7_9ACTN|nr:hypothetical protein Cco03nite_03650 [Catellatospora coxensis]
MLGRFELLGWHDGHLATKTMRVRTHDHGEVIIKIHRSMTAHEQEVHAYRTWTPALADRTPRLLATCETPPAMAVTAVTGSPLTELRLTAQQEQDAFAQAGALLRDLHTASASKHDPRFGTYLAERGTYWLANTTASLTPQQRAQMQTKLTQLASLDIPALTPCHLDFMPRNLMLGRDGILRLIDFEHARYDLAARDLVRITTRVLKQRPDLQNALHSTYGQLTALDEHVIDLCSVIDIASLHAPTRRLP